MLTDWLLIRRLAAELERTLRGKRIRAAGRIVDGRFGIGLGGSTIAIDVFGPTPIVTLEPELALDHQAGWVRAAASALEGLRFDAVRARRGDRLIAFDCSSRSRFGVQSGYRLVAELVPRFGNIVLLKDDTVVCAAKEFAPGVNAARSTVVGRAYEPPPLPAVATDGPSVETAVAALVVDTKTDREAASRALRAAVPLLPRLIADSSAAEAASLVAAGTPAAAVARRTLERASALVAATTGDSQGLGDIFTYRDEAGALVQCPRVAARAICRARARESSRTRAALGRSRGHRDDGARPARVRSAAREFACPRREAPEYTRCRAGRARVRTRRCGRNATRCGERATFSTRTWLTWRRARRASCRRAIRA